jgi:precorrin-6Y C5,15-methyltransferase (decarboxylating)
MCEILIFAGTTEGRKIAEYASRHEISAYVCVATEYGESLLPQNEHVTVSHKRLTEEEMGELMERLKPRFTIDATHPYAAVVTENIRKACENAGTPYVRLLRQSTEVDPRAQNAQKEVVYVDSIEEAVNYLEHTQGGILATTGSKELKKFTKLTNYQERVYARVLSLPKVAADCGQLGFEGKHLICMQGPFSRELNEAMLRQLDCRYLVTKESGSTGGFLEKWEAAKACGCQMVIIGRPLKEEGLSLLECKRYLAGEFHLESRAEISLIGIGMGDENSMTVGGREACRNAELIIGARRMVEAAAQPGQDVCYEYDAGKIKEYLRIHPEYERAAVVLSGDVGFYSGCKRLLEELKEYETSVHCGISSLVYFMSRIQKPWENVKIASAHGREYNLIQGIRNYPRFFAILGTSDGAASLASRLLLYGMKDVTMYLGERLSYPEEKIQKGTPDKFLGYQGDPLGVVYVENPQADSLAVTHGIRDEAFIRGKVPMTKEEVRSISLSKLRLQRDSVCYDVGAGTGSVSIEMALAAYEGKVYAIEKKPEAVTLLEENKKAFQADNLTILQGLAPDALEDLEPPTHAFIGGSSGNLKEILQVLLKKNPKVRIVINCIALETIGEAVNCMQELAVTDMDIVSVSVSKSKTVGRYHMMMGENPITILSCTGKEVEEE